MTLEATDLKPLSNIKKCPVCGRVGSGPYGRLVGNGRTEKRYQQYYFSHRVGKRQTWHYLSKKVAQAMLDAQVLKEAKAP